MNIRHLRIWLPEIQVKDLYAQKVSAKLSGKQGLKNHAEEEVGEILCYQNVSYISEIIQIELFGSYYNNELANYSDIKTTQEFIA